MSGTVVVTTVHGRHEHLARQHASLAAGSIRPDHVVVVAMGDPLVADVVAAGPLAGRTRVVDVPCDTHLPLAQARNRGGALAFDELGADLVVFLDVDCLAGTDLLEAYRDGWRRTGPGPRMLSGPESYLDPPGPNGYRAATRAMIEQLG